MKSRNLIQIAADAQLELYRRVIDWDERYRIEYGADLYGYLIKSFADQLGFGESFGHSIRACFGESVTRHLDDLIQRKRATPSAGDISRPPKGPSFRR